MSSPIWDGTERWLFFRQTPRHRLPYFYSAVCLFQRGGRKGGDWNTTYIRYTTRLKRWFPIFFLLFFYLTFQLLFRSISSALSIKGHNLRRNVIRPVSGKLHYSNVSQIPLSHPILKTVSIFASFPANESLIYRCWILIICACTQIIYKYENFVNFGFTILF